MRNKVERKDEKRRKKERDLKMCLVFFSSFSFSLTQNCSKEFTWNDSKPATSKMAMKTFLEMFCDEEREAGEGEDEGRLGAGT